MAVFWEKTTYFYKDWILRYIRTAVDIEFILLQNHAEDTLRQELVTLQEEKLNYESTAKVK